MKAFTISRLAQAGGVGVETVRYYQRRGLMLVPARSAAVRRYSDDDVKRLRFIKSAQASGFTLEQIRELLSLDADKNRKRAREIAHARIRDLDQKIAVMTRARRALKAMAEICASGRGRCPIIPAFD